MDTNEMIALGIVALAVLLSLRYFLGKKKGSCCGGDCLPRHSALLEKKDKAPKAGDKR